MPDNTDQKNPITWRELLAFAQSLPPEQLDTAVYAMGVDDKYGPIYGAEFASEDWVDDGFGDGPMLRSEFVQQFDDYDPDIDGEPDIVIASGAPMLWCDK